MCKIVFSHDTANSTEIALICMESFNTFQFPLEQKEKWLFLEKKISKI